MKQQEDTLYGIHAVLEAIQAGRELDKVLVRKGSQGEPIQEILTHCRERQVPVQWVPQEALSRVAKGGNHQGVVAFASVITYVSLEDILLSLQDRGEMPLILLLDGVSDVRNFGAIARTAECMGAHAIVIPDQGSARINMDALKTSAGALNYLPVCRVQNSIDAMLLMQQYGLRIVACTEKASVTLHEADLNTPVCLVLGSEEKGIQPSILKRADALVRIPMKGNISSLNVSVTAGMVLLEVVRQRNEKSDAV